MPHFGGLGLRPRNLAFAAFLAASVRRSAVSLPALALSPTGSPHCPFRSVPATSEPLWPPKPKLFDMATLIFRWRAWLGV